MLIDRHISFAIAEELVDGYSAFAVIDRPSQSSIHCKHAHHASCRQIPADPSVDLLSICTNATIVHPRLANMHEMHSKYRKSSVVNYYIQILPASFHPKRPILVQQDHLSLIHI